MAHKPVYTFISIILLALSILLVACGSGSEPAANDTDKATTANTSSNVGANDTAPDANKPAAQQSGGETAPETSSDTASSEEPVNEVESGSFLSSGVEMADPSQVQITSSWYIDEETGFLHVIGSVTNNTDTPISGQMSFIYYDTNGQVIAVEALETAESDTVPFSAPIAPGDTGYYERVRDLSKVQGEIANVEASLAYAVLETVSPVIEFSNLQWANAADGGIDISGQVKNSGATACVYPSLFIAYLKGSEVVGTGSYPLDAETLEPGSEIEFAFNEYFTPAGFDEVDVVIDCMPTSFPRP